MRYSVILTGNGKYKKTLYKCQTRETVFLHYQDLKLTNKILFPKKFVSGKSIKPIKYEICVTKVGEEGDTFRHLRDDYGKTYIEKPINGWTILDSSDYFIEETFWVFGKPHRSNRPTISEVVKKLMIGAHKRNTVKQVIVVHNKLLIYDENQFDMIICKCLEDAQRLHHTLGKICKKQKIKSLMFMGTASPATVSLMYKLISEKTAWSMRKIRRTSTKP